MQPFLNLQPIWLGFGARMYQNGTVADQEIVTNVIKQWVVTKYPLHPSRPISVTSTPIVKDLAPLGSVAPLAAVANLPAQEFFDTASQLMCANQPAHADKKSLQKMKKSLGFEPCSRQAFKKPDFSLFLFGSQLYHYKYSSCQYRGICIFCTPHA